MIAITTKNGHGSFGVSTIPANHTEALSANKLGLIISGGILLLMTGFIALIIHAVR